MIFGTPVSTLKDNTAVFQSLSRVSNLYDTSRLHLCPQVDGRGSEGRGLRWRDSLNIGDTDVADQLQAVRYFQNPNSLSEQILCRKVLREHSYLDRERVAVVGANYGGFLAALMLADRSNLMG